MDSCGLARESVVSASRDNTPEDTNGLIVYTTLGTEEDARVLARKLVEARIVACGTIIPGTTSIYRWKSGVKEETEALVVLKDDAGQMDRAGNSRQTTPPVRSAGTHSSTDYSGLARLSGVVVRRNHEQRTVA